MLKPRPDRPIDPLTRSVIRDVKAVTTDIGLDVFLVGATARIILLENVYGLHTGRATRDIDFAFAIETWDEFQTIKDCLTATAAFKDEGRLAHRLSYQTANEPHRCVVDLIPFGGLEHAPNTVAWPPDMHILMNVAGYRDAHTSAVTVEIEPGLHMPIASLPGLAVLKLIAWIERGQETPKDAIDLLALLRQYHQAGNQERVYETAAAALEAAHYDIEQAGAWLLGRDVAAMSSPTTRAPLNALFTQPARIERLVIDMSRANPAQAQAPHNAQALLEQFILGFGE